jgi:hypothetical protein
MFGYSIVMNDVVCLAIKHCNTLDFSKRSQTENEEVTCEACRIRLSYRKMRDHHMCNLKNSEGKPVYKCRVVKDCKPFTTVEECNTHMGTAHDKVPLCHYICRDDGRFQCAYEGLTEGCRQTFSDRTDFNEHLRFHAGIKEFICAVCSRAFVRRKHLIEHLQIHSDSVKVCEVENCRTELTSSQASVYYRHLRSIHHYTNKQIDDIKKLNKKQHRM